MQMANDTADTNFNMLAGNAASQYLTFMLDGEEYGVEILKVQEIKGWSDVTSIPNTPEHILGVLNLRGAIVPITDLRKRFNIESIPHTPKTVVIVIKVNHEEHDRVVGLVVDAVADVHELNGTEIRPAPDIEGSIHSDFVKGLANVGEKMIILLDTDLLFDSSSIEINS